MGIFGKKKEENITRLSSSVESEEDVQLQDESIDDMLDDFFGVGVDSQSPAPMASVSEKEPARRRDSGIDKVVSRLIRTVTKKKKVTREDLESIMKVTIGKIVAAIGAQAIFIFFKDDSDGKIYCKHLYYGRGLMASCKDNLPHVKNQAIALKQYGIPMGRGIVGKVTQSGKPRRALDAMSDEDFKKGVEKKMGFDVKSILTVPIKSGSEVYGAIQAMNKDSRTGEEFFSQHDMDMLEEVAGYSAKILHMVQNPNAQLSDEESARYVARLSRHEYFDLEGYEADPRLIMTVGEGLVRKYKVLPLQKLGTRSLKVVLSDPTDFQTRSDFAAESDLEITDVLVSPESHILQAIDEAMSKADEVVKQDRFAELTEAVSEELHPKVERIHVSSEAREEDAPIIELVNRIIEDAYSRGASDIHIEPFEDETIVRYRIDGVLEESSSLDAGAARPMVARIKIMSQLNVAEQRLPQDGRIKFKEFSPRGIDIDLRVATAPMTNGEKAVMRLLDRTSTRLGLDVMGFRPENLEVYRNSIQQPFGMVLHVGPTGSGKTTTLYAALAEINKPNVNIQTAEDPVEYEVKGINQLQIKHKIGLNFATALRSYLRQDPDVILVGEIRDLETAEIAVEAALTGHLLFSTLHTNDAAGTVVRFIEMGIEPFLVASSLLCVCAQRLMRKLCPDCKKPYESPKEEAEILKREGIVIPDGSRPKTKTGAKSKSKVQLYSPVGCERCNGIGYKGRMGVHELLTMNGAIRELVNQKVSADVIKEQAIADGMADLVFDALTKVVDGQSSIDEALRVVRVETV